MPLPVSLKAVAEEMDTQSDGIYAHINRASGELITISREEMGAVENETPLTAFPEWQQETIQQTEEVMSRAEWLQLPSHLDIHEYNIIRDFCYALEDEHLASKLQRQIRGSGAFRRFKDAIRREGIEQQWYRYKQSVLEKMAADWLDKHGIAYTQ